jgi:hypothetical protein
MVHVRAQTLGSSYCESVVIFNRLDSFLIKEKTHKKRLEVKKSVDSVIIFGRRKNNGKKILPRGLFKNNFVHKS